MATRRKKTWVYSPPRKPKPKVPDDIKSDVQKKGDEIVENIFKPEYVKPLPKTHELNHLIDIYTKWYRNYFYFCSTYACSLDALSSSFESKCARLEYLGENTFELSYMRHTGQWWSLLTGTREECLEHVSTMIPY